MKLRDFLLKYQLNMIWTDADPSYKVIEIAASSPGDKSQCIVWINT